MPTAKNLRRGMGGEKRFPERGEGGCTKKKKKKKERGGQKFEQGRRSMRLAQLVGKKRQEK